MTKTAFLVSLLALAAAGQASANGMPTPAPQPQGAPDPCLLGNAADHAACNGMIRVAPAMTIQSQSYQSSATQNSGPTVLFDPNRGAQTGPAQTAQPMPAMPVPATHGQHMTTTSTYTSTMSQSSAESRNHASLQSGPTSQVVSMNCLSPQAGAHVACQGYWVPAQPAQPMPPQVQPPAPQVVILQPPVAQSPIMVPPPPMMPPPATQTFVTQTVMPPVPCCVQPQEITLIPASFFMGGMSYGVGFPTETSYSYGGGGFAYVGGGTRFSGVRDRVHLVPPPRKHRPPPPKPCGCH